MIYGGCLLQMLLLFQLLSIQNRTNDKKRGVMLKLSKHSAVGSPLTGKPLTGASPNRRLSAWLLSARLSVWDPDMHRDDGWVSFCPHPSASPSIQNRTDGKIINLSLRSANWRRQSRTRLYQFALPICIVRDCFVPRNDNVGEVVFRWVACAPYPPTQWPNDLMTQWRAANDQILSNPRYNI